MHRIVGILLINLFLFIAIYIGCGGQGKLTQQGKSLIEQGNYAEAITVLSEAIQRNRADAEAHYQLAYLHHTRSILSSHLLPSGLYHQNYLPELVSPAPGLVPVPATKQMSFSFV